MVAHGSQAKPTSIVIDHPQDAFGAGEELTNFRDSESLLSQVNASTWNKVPVTYLESLPDVRP